MTSIEDAWGVSDLSVTESSNPFQKTTEQTKHLQSHVIPQSSVLTHPNHIVETHPTRMDVAVYHPKVIQHLFSKTPEIRTAIVTDLIRSSMHDNVSTKENGFPTPPSDSPKQITISQRVPTKEYFHVNQSDFSVWILITFILLLLDKLVSIWKNS